MKRLLGYALRLTLALLTILYASTTNAGPKLEEVMKITKGQKAPYQGILTPEERWRAKEEELAVCDFIRERDTYYAPDPIEPSVWTSIGGFVIGALSYALVSEFVRHEF